MKRYLVFTYDGYNPCGGMGDYVGDADTLKEAEAIAEEIRMEYRDILDTKTGEIL